MRVRTARTFSPFILMTIALAACDGSSPTTPQMPMPPTAMPGTATFVVSAAGQNQTISYGGTGNLVLCTRNAGWASLFIRFAEQAAAGGNAGPHLDLDLCAHQGGGTFAPKDPRSTSCAGGKTWDIWWHDADGTAYANQVSSPGCTLEITQSGTQMFGSFACRDLVEDGGARTVDILNGTFDCTEVS